MSIMVSKIPFTLSMIALGLFQLAFRPASEGITIIVLGIVVGLIMDLEDDRRSEIRKKRDDKGTSERVANLVKGIFGRLLPGEEESDD